MDHTAEDAVSAMPAEHRGGVDLLLQAVAEMGWGEVRPPFEAPKAVPAEKRDEGYQRRAVSWCEKALEGKCAELAGLAPNTKRNVTLNKSAYVLFRYVLAGYLSGEHVVDALREAALECGLSNGEIEATLGSAHRGANKDGPAEPPIGESGTNVDPFTGEVLEPAPTELVAPVVPDDAHEAFWTSRPMLEHIRDFARARRASPYGVLGVVLARLITQVPPHVTLPALVGSQASLNLFVALVGPSGSGKGAAEQCAGDAVDVGEVESSPVGSGEGIGHLYKRRDGQGNLHTIRTAVLFTIPEVDNLTALGQRQGATLMPQLRSAWSGEKIGFAYADPKKALPIDKHTYRMGLILGVQPGRAAPLLDDADGGTPQRFLWMPVTDPHAPDVAPPAPAKKVWRATWGGSWDLEPFAEYIEMAIPDSVRLEIGITALSRLRGQSEALDGHAGLAKLKTAAALGLLDSRREINEEDWKLAGHLMAVSDATRAGVVALLSAKIQRSNAARGEAEGNRAVLVEEKKAEAAAQRVARRMVAALATGELSKTEVRRAIAARDRVYFDDALERLVTAGQVAVEKVDKGEILRVVK